MVLSVYIGQDKFKSKGAIEIGSVHARSADATGIFWAVLIEPEMAMPPI